MITKDRSHIRNVVSIPTPPPLGSSPRELDFDPQTGALVSKPPPKFEQRNLSQSKYAPSKISKAHGYDTLGLDLHQHFDQYFQQYKNSPSFLQVLLAVLSMILARIAPFLSLTGFAWALNAMAGILSFAFEVENLRIERASGPRPAPGEIQKMEHARAMDPGVRIENLLAGIKAGHKPTDLRRLGVPPGMRQIHDERPDAKQHGRNLPVNYQGVFEPPGEMTPTDTERDPQFYIYPKEFPYGVVIERYKRDLNDDHMPIMPIVQFWTWHAWLNIQLPQGSLNDGQHKRVGPGLVRCHIADDSNDWCGSIVLDEAWISSTAWATHEFIALSEAKSFNLDECPEWTYYIPKERDQSEWDVYYVLLIEQESERWVRRGLGKVFKRAFAECSWKEIMLG